MTCRLSPRALLALAAAVLLAVAAAVAGVLLTRDSEPPKVALPLRQVAKIALPGDNSRLDYASLDPGRGLLFIAHLGASQVIEVDVHAGPGCWPAARTRPPRSPPSWRTRPYRRPDHGRRHTGGGMW
ncbi:hypothetical protein O1L55_36400 [Streptomyces albulus]|nr:hypothetical protein [Streptomyces noursei]